MICFYNTIVFVEDLPKSRDFYHRVLGLKIVKDYPTIVFFERHFVINGARDLQKTVFGSDPGADRKQGSDNLLVYFETDDLAKAFETVRAAGTEIIHGIEAQSWGQKVFRFRDPDGHILEIGEAMELEFTDGGVVEK